MTSKTIGDSLIVLLCAMAGTCEAASEYFRNQTEIDRKKSEANAEYNRLLKEAIGPLASRAFEAIASSEKLEERRIALYESQIGGLPTTANRSPLRSKIRPEPSPLRVIRDEDGIPTPAPSAPLSDECANCSDPDTEPEHAVEPPGPPEASRDPSPRPPRPASRYGSRLSATSKPGDLVPTIGEG